MSGGPLSNLLTRGLAVIAPVRQSNVPLFTNSLYHPTPCRGLSVFHSPICPVVIIHSSGYGSLSAMGQAEEDVEENAQSFVGVGPMCGCSLFHRIHVSFSGHNKCRGTN